MSFAPVPEPGVNMAASSSALNRIYSEETDESPFGSSLATPDDKEPLYDGIHERLNVANSILGYFESQHLSQALSEDAKKRSEPVADNVVKVGEATGKVSQGGINTEVTTEEDGTSISLLKALDSSSSLATASPILTSSSADSFIRLQSGLGSMYTLPNDHIVIEPCSKDSDASLEFSREETRLLVDSDSIPVFRKSDLGPEFWTKELGPMVNSLTCRALVSIAIKLVCFLPWCVAVGGALLFSPEHLEPLAFRTGYLEALHGIRRYSHWAEYGFQHIAAFLTFLGVVTWLLPTAGLLCIGGLLAQFLWEWHSFLVDRNIPLGENDKQTIYLLATTTWLNDTTVNIRKVGDSYYATDAREETIKDESDDSD